MKFKFKIQSYQTEAVENTTAIFAGQSNRDATKYRRDLERTASVTIPPTPSAKYCKPMEKEFRQPNLYIIAGCNGAGKTTASFTVLPEALECTEFVNADEIAKGLSPFHPEEVAIEAGRLMLERIEVMLRQRVDFAIETTLATKSYRNLIIRAREQGYRISLLFFWLSSPEMAEERVATRVASGGHNIPRDVIHRRYWAGLKNLFNLYAPIVDVWSLYDNRDRMKPVVVRNIVVDSVKLDKIKELCLNRKK